jgi:nitrate reductase NapE component
MGDWPRDQTTKPPTPRWVKVFAIIAVVVVLLVAVALVTGLGGPGQHGPGRHSLGGGVTEEQTLPGDGSGGYVPPPGPPDHDG